MSFQSRNIGRGLRCLIVVKKGGRFYDLKIVSQFWRVKKTKIFAGKKEKSNKRSCFSARILLSPTVPNRREKVYKFARREKHAPIFWGEKI